MSSCDYYLSAEPLEFNLIGLRTRIIQQRRNNATELSQNRRQDSREYISP